MGLAHLTYHLHDLRYNITYNNACQRRFDKELTRRLKSHLNAAMVATERMGNYRRRLLRILAQSGQAKVRRLLYVYVYAL